jgi:Uma2 family endonuclease
MPSPPTDTAWFGLAPDWICEIVSPSTALLDRAKKLRAYARHQVAHAWVIDPLARTLEFLRLEGQRWTILSTHAGAETVRVEPFAEIDLELKDLWIDAPSASQPGNT